MPHQCSCGAWPVVEFLPHTLQWRVECPLCGKVGAGFGEIDQAVANWNDPAPVIAHFTANLGAHQEDLAGVTAAP